MLFETESARSTVYYVVWMVDVDFERFLEGLVLVAVVVVDGGCEVIASAIQVYGGIGFIWEVDVHWLYKRAQLDAAMLGGARRYCEVLVWLAASCVAAAA